MQEGGNKEKKIMPWFGLGLFSPTDAVTRCQISIHKQGKWSVIPEPSPGSKRKAGPKNALGKTDTGEGVE